jgi:hypothetical protein
MPRGPVPSWTFRREPVTDAYVLASVKQAGGIGHHDPATGHYAEMVIRGLGSMDEAAEWKNSLYRCAHYLNRKGIAPVSMSQAKIERDGTGFLIRFRAGDKTYARQKVLSKYGPDRSKWPYDPRQRGA